VADAQTITGVKTFDNGLATDTISEETSAAGVTVDGVLLKDSQVTTDQINEKTSAAGVTIDGVLLKDSQVTTDQINEKTSAAGVTIDSVLLKDGTVKATTTIGVGNATPAASGAGITFPATQSASSDANTLDDYEQGTFTPTAFGQSSAGTTTYANQEGWYTKIGRQVHVDLVINWSAMTGTGDLLFGGLPFTIPELSAQYYPVAVVLVSGLNWGGGSYIVVQGLQNTSTMRLFYCGDDASANIQQCVNETAGVRISLTYFTAD
jgi:hypothetical protein